MKAISQEKFQIWINELYLKITYLKLQPHLPEDKDLKHWSLNKMADILYYIFLNDFCFFFK